MQNLSNKPVYILGDIHGDWNALFEKIKYTDIRDCILICVGDIGIGFLPQLKQIRQNEFVCDFLKSRDIEFLGIRGNHDNPAYFDGSVNYDNFKLLPDYTSLNLNGKQFLLVGGAISIDRTIRKEGISYWRDEAFKLDHSKIQRCDVLITHSTPTWNGPLEKSGIFATFCQKDSTLWDECMEERRQHDILIKLCGAKRHLSGHFHQHSVIDFEGCVSTIVDILQIIEIR
jgi:hypothetical protein